MKIFLGLILTCILVLPLHAHDFDYSQINVRYVSAETDLGNEGDGKEVSISYDFHRLVLSLTVLTLDYGSGALSFSPDTHVGGIGSYLKWNDSVDLYASIQYGVYNRDTPSVKLAEADLFIYKLGTRFLFNQNNEGQLYFASLNYSGNQAIPSLPVPDENMIGFRAILYSAGNPALGFNVGVEQFDSYRHVSMGVTLNY